MLNNFSLFKKSFVTSALIVGVCGALLLVSSSAIAATVRIAKQYGVGYLPMIVMQNRHLVERFAQKEGVNGVNVKWATVGGGATATSALLSGSVNFAVVGVGPMLRMWDKTRGYNDIHGVAALDSIPMLLNCNKSKIKSIGDLGPGDRIAVPSVKNSFEAIVLEMAAAEKWGDGDKFKLDDLTVSMKHPDAMAALLSGKGQIDCDFTTPPYYEKELESSNVHTIVNSYDVLGGKATLLALVGPKSYYKDHPKMYKAVFEALKSADRFINNNPHKAARIYIAQTGSKLPEELIFNIINDENIGFSIAPRHVLTVAKFMDELGMIHHLPSSWKQVFFKNVWNENGS